ncbi:DUF1992 domain-containing protein [Mycena kentingensis (nom. inval.)]|nr:DUF1992 domain-containing protein [Mycena kentingensis (nom. inval.)]
MMASMRPSLIVLNKSASAKLFADALKEEAERKVRRVVLDEQPPNWTGDERVQDTVLRLLVDKHRPLRSGTIQTADEKIRNTMKSFNPVHLPPGETSWSSVPLLPGSAEHRPWHTEFTAPVLGAPSIRHARAMPSRKGGDNSSDDVEDMQRAQKELHKRLGRASRAKESTLDYKLGLGVDAAQTRARPNPVSMRGWTNLIEDKIERARRAGVFATLKGRGKPLNRTVEETNPFIGREEYLMNRIVQRNGAAPPWVQFQNDLDDAVFTFRRLLLDSWTRHAIRSLPPSPSHDAIAAFRDETWSNTHIGYHTAALNELNAQVRRYNAIAPYAVRRALHVLDTELQRAYDQGPAEIRRVLEERRLTKNTESSQAGSVDLRLDWSWLWGRWRWITRLLYNEKSEDHAVGNVSRNAFMWLTTISLVFGGCCSNAITLEQLTSTYPLAGSLITFFQFLLISLHGLPAHISWKKRYPTLKQRRIPLAPYLAQVALFYLISLLNNAAFSYNIPMSVHIIFRSGGLIVSMVLGWAITGKRYSLGQIAAVTVVTLGVLLTTLSAANRSTAAPTASMNTYIQGIVILSLALLLSGLLGLAQDQTYSRYGRESTSWQESMFYLHFLALPMFVFVRKDIETQIKTIASGPRTTFTLLNHSLALPDAVVPLLLNTVTQLICVAGVHQLTTRISALTVTLILVVRKATSLLISVLILSTNIEVDERLMWSGATLVLAGTVMYSVYTGRKRKME